MARFLFTTWDGAGNQPPAVTLARALEKHGHDVVFAGYENQRRTFIDRGFRFVLFDRSAAHWRNTHDEMLAVKLRAAWASPDHLDELPELMRRERCDAVVVDCLMFGALAAAERHHVPAVALVHLAPGTLMSPQAQFETLVLEPVNRVRREAGLPRVDSLWDTWAQFPALSNSIRELDPRSAQVPTTFHYLGSLAEDTPSDWTAPWPRDDARPLVLVSFSTGPYWDQTSRITRTLVALSGCSCRVLVTAGSTEIDPHTVPSNAVVVKHAPHEAILPKAALTVTHAGHGTVMASLKHGVPLLCLPNKAADQPILATQVQRLGCGLALDGDDATAGEISAAAVRMLNEPSFALRSRSMAGIIAKTRGVAAAVSQLQRLVKSKRYA